VSFQRSRMCIKSRTRAVCAILQTRLARFAQSWPLARWQKVCMHMYMYGRERAILHIIFFRPPLRVIAKYRFPGMDLQQPTPRRPEWEETHRRHDNNKIKGPPRSGINPLLGQMRCGEQFTQKCFERQRNQNANAISVNIKKGVRFSYVRIGFFSMLRKRVITL
jgi:hypothetical protein